MSGFGSLKYFPVLRKKKKIKSINKDQKYFSSFMVLRSLNSSVSSVHSGSDELYM